MKYYAAVVSEEEIKAPTSAPPYNILCSYHYFKKKKDLVSECVNKGFNVFIDSGAFSAATKGVEIDIDAYCEFIKETKVGVYAGLDVIGNHEKTMANTKYMESKGLHPIPTYHLGGKLEDIYELLKYPYIALGGLVFSSGIERYCDEVWKLLLKERPDIRVHGFGLTNFDLMARYPWYSVDSSSYKGCRRFGRQQILWDGFEFKTFQEEEYLKYLADIGYKLEGLSNKERYFLYDFNSCQSYKLYAAHLKEINKTKDFAYLKNQQGLF
jgi:hypothetical protein